MGPKPRRVVRLACQAAARPRDGHAFPRGTASPRNAQTGFSWHGAAALFSPLGKKPARENAIHPLAQAKGLSGGEAVKVILHRPLEGVPKSATIRRSRTGKWYVSV